MREIKFRTLGIAGWVCGAIAPRDDAKEIHMEKFWNIVTYGPQRRRETLGEYTGLKDKNGVEIYEGDVLHFDEGEYAYNLPVFWEETDCVWMAGFPNDCDPLFDATYGGAAEVIGNIHENPELVKE